MNTTEQHPAPVVTGLGVATPAGCDLDTYWATLLTGRPVTEQTPLYGEDHPAVTVGRVDDTRLPHGFTKRHLKRVDRFVLMADAAARQALTDAGIEVDDTNRDRIGILVGNCTGGWGYVEPQMSPLYQGPDLDAINPYVATAWFPTAPQGEISIALGIEGLSKTLSAERISAGHALQMARHTLLDGRLDAVVVIGVEAPLTPLVHRARSDEGELSPSGRYAPFTQSADGAVLGEGASALVLESSVTARGRGAVPYAELQYCGIADSLTQAMCDALDAAPGPVDGVVLDARGTRAADAAEYEALACVLSDSPEAVLAAPAAVYGDLLGAALATSLVTACLALRRAEIPPSALEDVLAPPAGRFPTAVERLPDAARLMVNGTDNHGQAMSLLLAATGGPA